MRQTNLSLQGHKMNDSSCVMFPGKGKLNIQKMVTGGQREGEREGRQRCGGSLGQWLLCMIQQKLIYDIILGKTHRMWHKERTLK